MTRRCYGCDQAEAMYEAHLDHDATPVMLLCDSCAIREREADSVMWIRTRAGETDGERMAAIRTVTVSDHGQR